MRSDFEAMKETVNILASKHKYFDEDHNEVPFEGEDSSELNNQNSNVRARVHTTNRVTCQLVRLCPEDVVATVFWLTDDAKAFVHGVPLGDGMSKVCVEVAMKSDAMLVRGNSELKEKTFSNFALSVPSSDKRMREKVYSKPLVAGGANEHQTIDEGAVFHSHEHEHVDDMAGDKSESLSDIDDDEEEAKEEEEVEHNLKRNQKMNLSVKTEPVMLCFYCCTRSVEDGFQGFFSWLECQVIASILRCGTVSLGVLIMLRAQLTRTICFQLLREVQ